MKDQILAKAIRNELSDSDNEPFSMLCNIADILKSVHDVLEEFIRETRVRVEFKADKSVVTEADIMLNARLEEHLADFGLPCIGEETENSADVIRSGSYIAIDPIDGTSNFIRVTNGDTKTHALDYGVLIGVVRDGSPQIGGCLNLYTCELHLAIDDKQSGQLYSVLQIGSAKGETVASRIADIHGDMVQVAGSQFKDPINRFFENCMPILRVGGLGFRIISLCSEKFRAGFVYHQSQRAGLWDLAGPSVIASVCGVEIFDGIGGALDFKAGEYFPGNGAVATKGKFIKSAGY